jgi:hypothetical protein
MNCAVIIAVVEGGKIEGVDRLGFPEAEVVASANAIAKNWRVIRDPFHHCLGNPANAEVALVIRPMLGAAAELHLVGDLRTRNFPGVAQAQPLVRNLSRAS